MNTGKRLMKTSRKFYIIAFAIVLFLVICDSIYICRDSRIAFTGQSVSQKILTDIAEAQKDGGTYQVPEQGVNFTNAIEEKTENWGLLGFYTAMAGMVILLIARKFYALDVRTKEFYATLPVKERNREIFDYFSMIGIILLSALVQGAILLITQTRYNQTLVQLVREKSLGTLSEEVISNNNQKLMMCLLTYLLYFLWLYTWIYLCATVTKNLIMGVVVSVITPFALTIIWNNGFSPALSYDIDNASVLQATAEKYYKLDDFINSFFSPYYFFFSGRSSVGDGVHNSLTASNSFWILLATILAALLVCVFFIYFLSGKRELSKGKMFYFPILDYPFSLLCGVCIFFFLLEDVLWYTDELTSLIIGFISAVVICVIIHPFSTKKNTKWEVR
jgi:hypothetical protein